MSWAFLATKGQSAAVAAQYMLSGQQNQLASGQHPAGHEVSPDRHCLLLAIFMSLAFLATKGQSAAVAAQSMLSGQQNQLASGQQPAGHEVSPDPHCLFLAIFMSWASLATKGQSAAVAAQYMLSGQQNQLASGQQPAGHEVSPDPHCLLLAIFMSWAFLATKGQSAAVA